MKICSSYPVICTDKIQLTRDFYTFNFNFGVTFEADWYVSLKSKESPQYELALLDYKHPSLPAAYRQTAKGILLNFEVPDVDKMQAIK